ncbi:hypothetical protein M406DRAFT_329169 [Cryphonectria parasitica EP155]|uniref:Ribosomal protein S21 n=1 Tax=Cryphonectria parasitica (strain ATCC 38755 / EP155) TaxID=660469 RepID=A0A9P4Y7G5_CRYP1|nr:uncharacterized protein M406DRAFT_329169 [Cryphonectria parasitica EP155]KAF3768136.1 hypothetical protein M406DRAFT_329169 [Cryphonectria parasitica EP155]
MASYMRQHEQQQKQQQQRQNQVSGPGSATSFASRSIFQSNDTSSAASGASLLNPWVAPRSNTSALPRSSQSVVDNNMDGLGLSSWSSPTVQDLLTNRQHLGYERPADVKYRLRPVIGRTVELQNGVDVARGLAILNMKCSLNRVRADQTKQRFHERGGLKRKRLRRERWRARFKEGFKATCSRVRVLAKQGW